jgi:archaellum component FlaC
VNNIEKIKTLKQLYTELLSLVEHGKDNNNYFRIKTRINDIIDGVNDVDISEQNAETILKEIRKVHDDFYPPRGGLEDFAIWEYDSEGKYKFNDKLNQELDSITDKIWEILKEYPDR